MCLECGGCRFIFSDLLRLFAQPADDERNLGIGMVTPLASSAEPCFVVLGLDTGRYHNWKRPHNLSRGNWMVYSFGWRDA